MGGEEGLGRGEVEYPGELGDLHRPTPDSRLRRIFDLTAVRNDMALGGWG